MHVRTWRRGWWGPGVAIPQRRKRGREEWGVGGTSRGSGCGFGVGRRSSVEIEWIKRRKSWRE